MEGVPGHLLAQGLDGLQGSTLAPQPALDIVHAYPGAKGAGRQLAHPQPVLERCQGLVEGMLVAGHEPQLVHGRGFEHVQGDELMGNVRRIEATAEEGHPHDGNGIAGREALGQ
jgi:hypothetical protein